MEREKLLQNPLPIDRVAYRVTRPASADNLWRPMPKMAEHMVPPGTVLRTAQLPKATLKSNRALGGLPGKRRDRMVVVGYAEIQGSQNKSAKWVVRCDCGNYEHRTSILRWIGTHAPDMCRECRARAYKLGRRMPDEIAVRDTVQKALGGDSQ